MTHPRDNLVSANKEGLCSIFGMKGERRERGERERGREAERQRGREGRGREGDGEGGERGRRDKWKKESGILMT